MPDYFMLNIYAGHRHFSPTFCLFICHKLIESERDANEREYGGNVKLIARLKCPLKIIYRLCYPK